MDHVVSFQGRATVIWTGGTNHVEDQFVTEQHIAEVLSACDVPAYGEGREVLHAQPVNLHWIIVRDYPIRVGKSAKSFRPICTC